MAIAVLLLTAVLAAVNGGNDVSKGVATLAGAGVTRYKTAILWGTAATLTGCFFSLTVADKLTKLFSSEIVTQTPTDEFTLAVLVGAGAWVLFATITKLPVSTTQSIVGALVGAGLVVGSSTVAWGALPKKILLPTALAIGVAYGISFLLSLIPRRVPECICISSGAPVPVAMPGGVLAFTAPPDDVGLRVTSGTVAECRVHGEHRARLTVDGVHWLSSGAASFARGLNDAPKIVAVGAFTLVPWGMTPKQILFLVAGAMAIGSLVAGIRVAQRLGDDILPLDHVEGAKANFATAVLVGLAAGRGFPLSTTQVSASAIAGASGTHPSRLNRRTIRDFVIAWTVTPVAAGLVAAATYVIA
jgi:PiT family inorganic phosphate transporter